MISTTQEWKIGDCLDLLPSIETGSIDMILCDLPYGSIACAWDQIIPFEPLWIEYKRILKEDGVIALTASQPFTSMLVMSNLEMFKYEWIWNKVNGANFMNLKNRPFKTQEQILIFSKTPSFTFHPIRVMRTEKSLQRDPIGRAVNRKTYSKNIEYYGAKRNGMLALDEDGMKHPIDIIKFSIHEKWRYETKHTTKKPVALFEYLIKTYTNEGDTIHDSCLGSGTTLEACRRTNRNCIGFEISDEWEHLYADRCLKNTPPLQSYF